MEAHRIETTVTADGQLTLKDVPVRAGDHVEVIVLVTVEAPRDTTNSYPLRGTPLRYDDPFEPAAAEDWDAPR